MRNLPFPLHQELCPWVGRAPHMRGHWQPRVVLLEKSIWWNSWNYGHIRKDDWRYFYLYKNQLGSSQILRKTNSHWTLIANCDWKKFSQSLDQSCFLVGSNIYSFSRWQQEEHSWFKMFLFLPRDAAAASCWYCNKACAGGIRCCGIDPCPPTPG